MAICNQSRNLQQEDYLNLSNIRFDVLLPSYQSLIINTYVYEKVNMVLLDLLSTYDESENKSENRRKEILNTAKAFAVWLIDTDEKLLAYEVKKFQSVFNI